VLDTAASNIVGFLGEINMFFNSLEWDYLEESDHISNLKNLHCRKYSIQNRTKFSQGNNMLHCPASNTDGFISRDICVASSYLDRLIDKK
jgi:hypothetical protein